MARSNSVITTEPMIENGQEIGIVFRVKGAGYVPFDLRKVHPNNAQHAAMHGFIQRISDAAAMSRDTKTGEAASPADKLEAMRRLVAHYESGTPEWSRVREAGPKGGLLFDALCEVYGHKKAPTEIREWLDTLSDKEQAALREDDTIAPVIARIKAERAKDAPKMDTKAILAGLQ